MICRDTIELHRQAMAQWAPTAVGVAQSPQYPVATLPRCRAEDDGNARPSFEEFRDCLTPGPGPRAATDG